VPRAPKVETLLLYLPPLFIVLLRALGFLLVVPLTGSMEPTIPRGSLVLVVPAWLRQPGPGDVALVRVGGALVLHRVVGVAEGGLLTKGDARPSRDPWVAREAVGVAVAWAPLLGYPLLLLRPLAPPLAFLACYRLLRRLL